MFLTGFGEDLTPDELQKAITMGEMIEKILSGEIPATEAEKEALRKIVASVGEV